MVPIEETCHNEHAQRQGLEHGEAVVGADVCEAALLECATKSVTVERLLAKTTTQRSAGHGVERVRLTE